jgi:cell wall-associated NlpC family hydrolase
MTAMSKYLRFHEVQSRAALAAVGFCLTVLMILLASMPALADPDLAEQQAEASSIRDEMASINLEAEQAVERYNQAKVELDNTEQRIADNEQLLDEASINLAQSQRRLNKRIESIYRQGSISMMDVFMNTNSFGDFISRFELLGRIGDQDKTDVESVLHYKNEVESIQSDLEQSRSKQAELVESLSAEQADVESRLAERQALLDSVEGDIAAIIAEQEAAEQQQADAAIEDPGSTAPDEASPSDDGSPDPVPPEENPPYDPAPEDSGSYDPPPPTSGSAVDIAMQYLGVPYVWGGESPSGFDCSGLVMYVYAQIGVYLPHSAASQYYSGTPISYGELAPGDLVFFGSPISHVGIYIGGGNMIHAPFEGAVVSVSSVSAGGSYSGACRL